MTYTHTQGIQLPMKPTIASLQQELANLQVKYDTLKLAIIPRTDNKGSEVGFHQALNEVQHLKLYRAEREGKEHQYTKALTDENDRLWHLIHELTETHAANDPNRVQHHDHSSNANGLLGGMVEIEIPRYATHDVLGGQSRHKLTCVAPCCNPNKAAGMVPRL